MIREVLLALAEEPQGGSGASGGGGSTDISAAFEGAGRLPLACFLHLLYAPRHATSATLAALDAAGCLADVAVLAHKLDCAGLLGAVESHLQGEMGAEGHPL